MSLKIGFAEKFYTLWDVSEPYREYVSQHSFFIKQDFLYIRNLSMDREEAIRKMANDGCFDIEIDETLRGMSRSWSFKSSIKYDYKDYQFPNGFKNEGGDIRTSIDIGALWIMFLKKDIVFTNDKPMYPEWKRPIVIARRRLIELGILIKFEGQWITEKYKDLLIAKKIEAGFKDGHHFEESEKITIIVKELKRVSFDTIYGRTWIITYIDSQNRKFYYMGGTPRDFGTEFVTIKATVKLGEYKGVNQTKLLRIKEA